ncbi:hypothetical protein CWC12_18845 [Pseudoalteromonas ruthenica]|uniref:Uncharacterized protein n=1 Tax=Pseudoalteromonas ruthenica TaxID=151081 RepID=A0A5S3YZX1_9GAMM|nr:hypothetical protein EXT46_02240 [Pseudoalteromonas sp. CO325X]TLX49573.1 hypothetical protein CWC31_15650 [Pseudoalteromonas ruthenica]TMO84413.1 hypothetical protein CWC12_18845 [Pseudoalteromonas ruthenica]TMO93272.1 hypothetical protein CWC13_07160 [Pseudoalteromonas ruthenica]TMO99353.1 hypothetical protein CWC07_08010 [Pseudoalteromonas ruthenica]
MTLPLLAYLLIFALFGVAATYFVKFLYFHWYKNEIKPKFIIRALVCIAAVTVLSLVLSAFGY